VAVHRRGRLTAVTSRRTPISVVALSLGVFAATAVISLGACGGGDDDGVDPTERASLVGSLGFLADSGLTPDEIQCVADHVAAAVEGDELDRFSTAMVGVDTGELSLADLPDGQGRLLSEGVAACTGTS